MNKLLRLWTLHNTKLEQFTARTYACHRYSYAIPNDPAIQEIASHSPIIELGAGTGYWARLISDAGGEIVAFDQSPPDISPNGFFGTCKTFFNVEQGSIEKLAEYPDHTLFLCWPDYDTSFASSALEAYTGNTFIYIGEGAGGCTGDDKFHSILGSWKFIKSITIPSWDWIHDRLEVYQRNL